jgi:hypothetical protein
MKKRAGLLLALGLFQMTGALLGFPILQNIGKASALAPAPKVFCAVDGYEAYATQFFLEWIDRDGGPHTLPLTADRVDRLRGPYNRRNVYGAALAYGPILPGRIRSSVLTYALTGDAPLLREMGIDPAGVRDVWLRYEPLPGTTARDYPRRLGPETP